LRAKKDFPGTHTNVKNQPQKGVDLGRCEPRDQERGSIKKAPPTKTSVSVKGGLNPPEGRGKVKLYATVFRGCINGTPQRQLGAEEINPRRGNVEMHTVSNTGKQSKGTQQEWEIPLSVRVDPTERPTNGKRHFKKKLLEVRDSGMLRVGHAKHRTEGEGTADRRG